MKRVCEVHAHNAGLCTSSERVLSVVARRSGYSTRRGRERVDTRRRGE